MRACRGRSYRPMGAADERVDLAAVKASLDGGEHFWLDLGEPRGRRARGAPLGACSELHPLVRDDLGCLRQAREGRRLPHAHLSSSCSGRRTTPTAWSRRTSFPRCWRETRRRGAPRRAPWNCCSDRDAPRVPRDLRRADPRHGVDRLSASPDRRAEVTATVRPLERHRRSPPSPRSSCRSRS